MEGSGSIKFSSSRWFQCAIAVLGIFVPNVATSQTIQSSACPISWLRIVEKVVSVRSELPAGKNVILFCGSDGEVYNCLDEPLADTVLEQIRFSQKSLAIAMAQNRLQNPGTDTGYCDYGSNPDESSAVQYMFNLPYDAAELNSDQCAGSLEISLRNLGLRAPSPSSTPSIPK